MVERMHGRRSVPCRLCTCAQPRIKMLRKEEASYVSLWVLPCVLLPFVPSGGYAGKDGQPWQQGDTEAIVNSTFPPN